MNTLDSQASRYQFGQTNWSKVFEAARPGADAGMHARGELLVRYHDAVYRYLIARLGDSDAAGELFSRFAERVVELHPFLQRANPEKGRFRDYLKAVLSRMVIDYHRERQRERKRHRQILEGSDEEPVQPPEADADEQFRKVWAEELLNHAWKGLERLEQTKGGVPYSILLHKAQNPAARSEAMAQHFSEKLGKPISAANMRQMLHRSQELLSDLLIDEVARSLREHTDRPVGADEIEAELIHLDLFDKHRRDALQRFRENSTP